MQGLSELRQAYEFSLDTVGQDMDAGGLWRVGGGWRSGGVAGWGCAVMRVLARGCSCWGMTPCRPGMPWVHRWHAW